jgi:hypothetical protein
MFPDIQLVSFAALGLTTSADILAKIEDTNYLRSRGYRPLEHKDGSALTWPSVQVVIWSNMPSEPVYTLRRWTKGSTTEQAMRIVSGGVIQMDEPVALIRLGPCAPQ